MYWWDIYLNKNMLVNLVWTAVHVKSSETRRNFVHKTCLEQFHIQKSPVTDIIIIGAS